jgi:hypothetical protein
VPFEVRDDRGRDAGHAATGPGLRRPEHERPAGPLHIRGADPDGARFQVQVGPRSAVISPLRRLAEGASSTSARYRRSWVQSARPSKAIFHSACSAAAARQTAPAPCVSCRHGRT